MRRRSTTMQDSLDLFLDAICNTFGGIVLISIVAAILLQATSRQAKDTTSDVSANQIEELRLTLSQMHTRETVQTQAIQVLEEIVQDRLDDPETRRLVVKLKQLESVRDQQVEGKQQSLEDLATRAKTLESRRTNIRSLNEQLRDERNQRSTAQRVLMAEREARTINAPLPKATARNRYMVEVGAFLKGGRYYELHTYTPDGRRTGLNTDDFVVVSDAGEGVHVIPKPYAGIEISDSSASRTAIRRRLGRFQANSVYVCFVVRKDSFAEFDVVRSVAVDLGLQYRVIPTDGEVVDRGGRDTKTQ